MRLLHLTGLVLLLLMVCSVSAVPVTSAVTNIGNNNFTLSCTGATGDVYFKYGTDSSRLNYWTMNVTSVAGAATSNEYSSPIQPSTPYYVTACDASGCDVTPVSFTTLAISPVPTTTLGLAVTNMTKNRFNMMYLPANVMIPYGWLFPSDLQQSGYTIVFGTLLFFVYVGLWLRSRSVAPVAVIGLLTSFAFLYANQGLNLGIPVEFVAMSQALLYASLAGLLLALLKK